MSTDYQQPTPPEEIHLPENAPSSPDYSEDVDVRRLHGAIAREKQEPVDGMEPVPLWLVAVIGLIIFWSGAYFMTYSGGFSGMYYDTVPLGGPNPFAAFSGTKGGTTAATGAAAGGAAKADDPVALGQRFFTQTCVSCHQATGLGQAGAYPPLAGSEYVNGDPKRLAAIVLHGVQGPITVAGSTFNSQMQAWGPTLNDKRIAYILTYVRQAWGNKGGAIAPELVAEMRKATASKTTAWTEAELKAFK